MIDGPLKYCPRCGTQLTERSHTGKIRPTCPNCQWVYFADPKVAVAVLIQADHRCLLVQRRYDPHRGTWTLPSGFVDAGEDPRQAARRECLEETGLVIGELKLLDVIYSQEHPRGASILILYRADSISGELSPGDDAAQAAFFDLDHLPVLAFLSTQTILNQYIS